MNTSPTPYILDIDFQVTSADVDFQQKLKVSSLANMFIQAAWQHAEELGWGADELAKQNLAWVLSSVHIKIEKLPLWKQHIQCKTWPKGTNRLFYLRDFILYDEANNKIATATSNWLIIDIERRRPKFIELDKVTFEQNIDKHAIKGLVPPIKFEGNPEFELEYTIKYSDIDINKHLTTTRYIDLLFDTYSPDELQGKDTKEIIFYFNKEVKFNEKVKMLRGERPDNTTCFQLVNETKGNVAFLAQVFC